MLRPLRAGPAIVFLLLGSVLIPVSGQGQEPANADFHRTWARHDDPVVNGRASRTWMWGPQAYTDGMMEPYDESPGGERQVQYFDKARMEITDPDDDGDATWYVTNGLLVVELITGEMQVGEDRFEHREPAEVNVAGDWDDPEGPTYATFNRADNSTEYSNGVINVRLSRDGAVFFDSTLTARGVENAHEDPVTRHWIAEPFWKFMNSRGIVRDNGTYRNTSLFRDPLFATGRPITRAYWANVKVGGSYQDVLLQCFERRCLTYTPGNDDGWQVEAGNVGQHYFAWRYQQPPVDTLWEPHAVAVSADGTVYIGSGRNNQVLRYTTDGEYLGGWGSDGSGLGQLAFPTGLAVNSSGIVYVVENNNHRVQLFTASGLPFAIWTGRDNDGGSFLYPYGVAIDSSDNVYVTDHFNHRVQKFSGDGAFLTEWGEFGIAEPGHLRYPSGIAVGPDGTVYVADTLNDRVQMFTPQGDYISEFSGGNSGGIDGMLRPYGIAVRDDGLVFVADSENQRIRMFDADGSHSGDWDLSWVGQFSRPVGLAIDSSWNVYVVDAGEYRVLKFAADGELQLAFIP